MAGALCLGYSSGSSGTYNLNGGLLNVSSLRGGRGAAAFNWNGGTLQAGSGFSSSLAMTLGTSSSGASFDTAGYTVTLSGPLSGAGGLTLNDSVGTGALTLTGSNTYSGPTTINQGKLVVDGWLTNSAVSVDGGTLGGTGYLRSVTVNPGGNLAPGDALGTLSVSGSLILVSGSLMDYELDTPSTSDTISCGSLTLNGQQFSDFNFTPTDNFGPGSYDLIAFASSTGSLGAITSGTVDGLPATLTLQSNDLVLTVVPEPSTATLLGACAAGLICWLWRRRHENSPRPLPAGYPLGAAGE
jgi:autotransporter-associated beta strand protein